MKRILTNLAFVFTVFLAAAGIFTGCSLFAPEVPQDGGEHVPPPPILKIDETRFEMQSTFANHSAFFGFVWAYDQRADKYYAQFEGGEIMELSSPRLSFAELQADVIHTLRLWAVSDGQTTAVTEIKLKGNKLSAPTGMRMSGEEGKGLVWNGESAWYDLTLTGFDMDNDGKYIETDEVVHFRDNATSVTAWMLQDYLGRFVSDVWYKAAVRAIPTDKQEISSINGEAVTFDMPSDYCDSDVKLWAAPMSNPTNLRWDGLDFAWDGVSSEYRYSVTVHNPQQWWSGGESTEANSASIDFDYYTPESGEYRITVQSKAKTSVRQVDAGAITMYQIFVETPVTEELTFTLDRIVLAPPTNIRIDGDRIVWDEVAGAESYRISLNGTVHFEQTERSLTLEEISDNISSPAVTVTVCGFPTVSGTRDKAILNSVDGMHADMTLYIQEDENSSASFTFNI